jgi:hypothetical protein
VLLLLPSLAGMFFYSSVSDSPLLLFGTQGALPSLLCVFFVVLVVYSVFFFFPWVGVSLSRGLC